MSEDKDEKDNERMKEFEKFVKNANENFEEEKAERLGRIDMRKEDIRFKVELFLSIAQCQKVIDALRGEKVF